MTTDPLPVPVPRPVHHSDNAVALWQPRRVRLARFLCSGRGVCTVLLVALVAALPATCFVGAWVLPGPLSARQSDLGAGIFMLGVYACVALAMGVDWWAMR